MRLKPSKAGRAPALRTGALRTGALRTGALRTGALRTGALRAAALSAAALVCAPNGARAADLAAHRALYKLTLESSRGSDVAEASGTMGYEVIDACDGWAVRQRLQMTITNRDGQDIEQVSDYATWESKDGLSFRFHTKQTTDTAVTAQVDGDATLKPERSGGTARYTAPKEETKDLPPGTILPMAHTLAIIDAARAGKKFLAVPLFDGTSEDGAQDSSIAILGWDKPAESKWPVLSPLPSTKVHIAFFNHSGEPQTPEYEVGMRYWENGVADDMDMDFGDFVMHGALTDLTPLEHHC